MNENTVLGELEDLCTCWVCFEVFVDPTTLHCGHTFCKECAEKVHQKNPSCPFCRRPYQLPLPPINQEVVELVAQYLKSKETKNEPMLERVPQDAFILQLPEEVVLDILSFLPPKEIAKSSKLCQDFKRMSNDPYLWREICTSSFPFCSVDKYGKNWKWCYIARSQIKYGWAEGKASQFEVTTFRGHKNYISCFQLYRNNIVSGSGDFSLKVWKVDKEDPINTLVGHNGLINCVQFNEVRIASGSQDRTLKIWDTKSGLPVKTLKHSGGVSTLQFDDNKIISSGEGDRSVKVWDIRDGSQNAMLSMNGHTQNVYKLIFDNNHVISGGFDTVKVWDLRTGNLVRDLNDHSTHASCFSLVNANQVVTGCLDGQMKLWDINTGANSTLNGPRHYAKITDIQSDGKNIASADANGSIKYWDVTYKKLLHTLEEHKGPVNNIQFSGNKLVSGGSDNSLKVWDLKKGTRLYTLLGGSLQKRANNPDHPTKQGCTQLEFDDSRIVASFASLLRVYDFEVYKPPNTNA